MLSLLRKHYPGHISGEEISRLLGVSRTAVWKHIRRLKEKGYLIDSHSRVGYRLINSPDKLYEDELKELLTGKIIGINLVYRETVSSTNELAKQLAQSGAVEGTVVIAEEQTAGKGRRGRTWYSPAGRGLWFTVILRPSISPVDAAKTTLLSAVAVCRTIREMTGIRAGIKWPNDILIDDRKVAGILTEMNAEIDAVNYLVIGIGVNFNLNPQAIPEEITEIATSVFSSTTGAVSRAKLLAGMLNNLDDLYGQFLSGKFAEILTAWKDMSVTLDNWVIVESLDFSEEGRAVDVDEDGALLILKEDGTVQRILAGDVSIKKPKPL